MKVENDIFYDGILYIISCEKNKPDFKHEIDVLYLDGQYSTPISLDDIARKYPNVCKVIYDMALRGYVYNYNNHRDIKGWEQVGTTEGYA